MADQLAGGALQSLIAILQGVTIICLAGGILALFRLHDRIGELKTEISVQRSDLTGHMKLDEERNTRIDESLRQLNRRRCSDKQEEI